MCIREDGDKRLSERFVDTKSLSLHSRTKPVITTTLDCELSIFPRAVDARLNVLSRSDARLSLRG